MTRGHRFVRGQAKLVELLMRWVVVGGVIVGFLLAQGSAADATPITLTDPFGQSSDVIGTVADFDIQKIVFTSLTSSQITAELYFNSTSNPGAPLLSAPAIGGYQYNYLGTFKLSVGDLLFDVGGTYKYGVALTPHDGLTAGNVYSLTGGSVFTSNQRMNDQGIGGGFRADTPVQIGPTHPFDAVGSAPVVSAGGDTTYKVTVGFDPSNAFWTDVLTAPGGMSVHFASATCANDVIHDNLPVPVPEPGTLLLLGSGLVAAGVVARRTLART